MKNLFIVKRIINDKTISDEAFTVWCGLRNIMQQNVMEYFVSFSMIGYSVFKRVPTRYETDAIKKGYKELVEKEYIKEVIAFNKTEFVVDLSVLYFEVGQEYFSNLRDDEMHKIMNLDCGNQSKYKLLRYFACQISTFNLSEDMCEYKGKIGGMGLDNFVEILGYSKVSIITYNDILSENRLLFVHNHGDFYQGTNSAGKSELREIPNTYARYEDMELALHFISTVHGYKFYKTDGIIRSAKANERRGLAQKLKHFKAGKEYDTETIKALYRYAEEKNEKENAYHNAMVKNGYDKHEPDLIDMSIFDDYLLEIC